MQLYAFDEKNEPVPAWRAEKGRSYFCPECRAPLRLRGGRRRKKHFYHLASENRCRQQQKSLTHLAVQERIRKNLPFGEAELERPFPEIGRIADVAWEKKRIVFEVQYSLISGEELLARNYDYGRAGYQTVWIFHERRYNQRRLTEAEEAVGHMPHYFTDIFPNGTGRIYDQQSLVQGWRRLERGQKFPVDLSSLERNGALPGSTLLRLRDACWPYHFRGDLFERRERLEGERESCSLWRLLFREWIARPYLILLQDLLEQNSM